MLIAVDLDGTLFNKRREVSTRTANTLAIAQRAGYTVVAVTGRSWRTCAERLKCVSAIDYAVCSNGAYAYNIRSQSINWSRPVDAAAALQAVRQIRKAYPAASFGWECASGISYERAFIQASDDPETLEHGGTGGVLGSSELHKMYIRVPGMPTAELQHALSQLVGEVFEMSTSGVPFLDATAAGANKASGLAQFAGERNLDAADVIAFGDNLNDMPMLRWAGTAVAMGNAHRDVLQLADSVTVSNNRDGVAVYLDKLLRN